MRPTYLSMISGPEMMVGGRRERPEARRALVRGGVRDRARDTVRERVRVRVGDKGEDGGEG